MNALLEGIGDDVLRAPWQTRENRWTGTAAPLFPAEPGDWLDRYDLTLSRPTREMAQFGAFDHWLAQSATHRGLTCAVLHGGTVPEAIRRLQTGTLRIHFHLDYFALWHVANDPYARLAQAVEDAGGRSVNPPARSRLFTDKAAAHVELTHHGFGVPETVLFRTGCADRPLTDFERSRLGMDEGGAGYFLKPANGFGQRGVVRVDNPEKLFPVLAAARKECAGDTFLIQREVCSPWLRCDDGADRPAYWRVWHCFGELIPFWWSKAAADMGRPSYRRLSAAECRRHGLWPVLAYVQDLAQLCGLNWFSTEVCLSTGRQRSRYTVLMDQDSVLPVVAIDYVNDQCDVDVQSRWLGAPPDAVVRHVADRFADAAESEKKRAIAPVGPRLRLFRAA